MEENKFICLFGGDDYGSIQELIKAASEVAIKAGIELEMVYICKKNTRQEHITKIKSISKRVVVWDQTQSTLFWKRIESMMNSMIHNGAKIMRAKEQNDPILNELISMLTLGNDNKGWGLISHGAGVGPDPIAKAKVDVIVQAFKVFSSWKNKVKEVGFVTALHAYVLHLPEVTGEHHCNKLTVSWTEDIPHKMFCGECGRSMEMSITYSCCNDQ